MGVATARKRAIAKAGPAQLAKYFQAKLSAELGPHNVKRLLAEDPNQAVVLDVRSKEGFDAGHVPGAVHIQFEELPLRMKELQKNRDIIVYCWDVTCLLCTKAAFVLASHGFRAREMLGGIQSWKDAGFPIEK